MKIMNDFKKNKLRGKFTGVRGKIKSAGVAGLLATTAVTTIGSAAFGIAQASASPGIAPPPAAAGLSDDNILNRLDRFAHAFAAANYPDDTSGVRMSETPDLYSTPSGVDGTAVYKNLNNPSERFSVHCTPAGQCQVQWFEPKPR